MTDARQLIGKRILAKVERQRYGYNSAEVQEFKVLEVSPSGSWVKVMNLNGTRFWIGTASIGLIEELKSVEARPEVGN